MDRIARTASAKPRWAGFDAGDYREPLLAVLREIVPLALEPERASTGAPTPIPAPELERILRRHPKDGRGLFSRAELIAGVRRFGAELEPSIDPQALIERLKLRPVRTASGVTPVTVLTKPFPCPGRCVFCPNDMRMPKSYLSREPGAQRAALNGFDPYLQTYHRLLAFSAMGHPLDKVELIVLGGTFSHYPNDYQRWFVARCFEAMNDLGAGRDARAAAGAAAVDHAALPERSSGRDPALSYNRELTRFLRERHGGELLARAERASLDRLERAQRENERSACRNVGLSLETRPDCIDQAELLRLRALGCTKLQLGVQTLAEELLARNQRGHDLAATRRAFGLARTAGFKLQAHIMPNLLGATPAGDLEDFRLLFADPDFRPDELKIYPCSLIESAELMRHYESGAFRPYEFDQLFELLASMLAATPRYCRVSRMVRDISSEDIVAGNRRANFRELAEQTLRERGTPARDIRSRELRGARFDADALVLRVTPYASAIGEEQFLELCTPEDQLVAFLRLSLPARASFVDELGTSAVVRELHVYGAALSLGERHASRAQHRGLGGRLLEEAAARARAQGYTKLSVISAVGTREYYRRQGFRDGALYQHRTLTTAVPRRGHRSSRRVSRAGSAS